LRALLVEKIHREASQSSGIRNAASSSLCVRDIVRSLNNVKPAFSGVPNKSFSTDFRALMLDSYL